MVMGTLAAISTSYVGGKQWLLRMQRLLTMALMEQGQVLDGMAVV
jgi:hypothetical protein